MGEIFGSIYCWFEDFFGLELADYLWGISSPLQTTNMFVSFGLVMLCLSALFMVVFYYVLNHPKCNTWWGWLIFLVLNAGVNFIYGWRCLCSDFYNDKMVDANGDALVGIAESNFLCFGVSNAILSIVWFFFFSLVGKWWSTNCSHTPF